MPTQQCLEGSPLARDGGGGELAIGIDDRSGVPGRAGGVGDDTRTLR
jgi:hypothetical protein